MDRYIDMYTSSVCPRQTRSPPTGRAPRHLSIYLSIYLSIHPSIDLSIYLSIYTSIHIYIYTSSACRESRE